MKQSVRLRHWSWRGMAIILLLLGGFSSLLVGQSASAIDLATENVDFQVVARDGDDRLGSTHAIATGDFNNDGVADFLLGVPGGDGPDDRRRNVGEVYIIFGRANLPPSFNVDGIPGPDVIIYGRDLGDRLGSSVAAGDVNGDGIDDVVLSAPDANGSANNRDNTGEVVVLTGRRDWSSRIELGATAPDLIVYNNRQQSEFGADMDVIDLNGDAIPDLVIGDPAARGSAGSTYVLFGRRDLPDRLDIARPDDVDITIEGADPGDRLGQSLAGADLNGDTIEDLVVAAPLADGPQNSRPDGGSAFIVLGRSDLPSVIDLGQTSPDATIYGAAGQNRLGSGLDLGDLNGDGLPDVVIGAPGAGGPNSQQGAAGSVYVIHGASQFDALYDLSEGSYDVRIDGSEALENAGESVSVADLDRDDQMDLIIGAPAGNGAQGDRANAGTVYVVRNDEGFAAQLRLGAAADLVVYGANGGDQLGAALDAGAVTDANEGVLLMGAPGVDSQVNGPDAGIVYLLRAADLIQPNQPPTADAGPDQTVAIGDTVDLDGSGSSDPEGGELTFSWTLSAKPSESAAELSEAETDSPSFTADVEGEYVIDLTVEDERGATATDTVRVTAGTAQEGGPGDVDGDGDVTILDARLVCEAVLGDRELSDEERARADVAPPIGEITLQDAQWIAEAAVGKRSLESSSGTSSSAAASPLRVLSTSVLRTPTGALEVRATGVGIQAVRLQVFDLAGRQRHASDWHAGPRLSWDPLRAASQPPANGIYLALVSVRGVDGTVEQRIIKTMILR